MHPKVPVEFDKRVLVIMPVLFFIFVSCNSSGNSDKGIKAPVFTSSSNKEFAQQLRTVFENADTGKKQSRSIGESMRSTYRLNDYKPLWLTDDGGLNKSAEKFIAELQDVQWDGIDPERYNITVLKKLQEQLKANKNTAGQLAIDTAFTHSYLAASRDLLMGEILPKTADSLWFHKNDSAWSAPAMLLSNDVKYTSLNEYRSEVPTYTLLRDEYKRYYDLAKDSNLSAAMTQLHDKRNISLSDSSAILAADKIIKAEMPWVATSSADSLSEQVQLLKAYQDYAGVRPTGKFDSSTLRYLITPPAKMMESMQANMERIRWMQKKLGNQYILVDVPLAEFFFRKDGQNVMHMRTVVGKVIRQTPSLDADMANVVINPPWGVPPTILKKDVLPGMTKSRGYLAKKGLKAYDKKGHVVNAKVINANNYKHFDYKQDPGDGNSLGYVKFNLPNPWDIYLHDTPHRGDFGNRYRCLSSGCIRLQQPQPLALYILGELEQKRYTQERLDSIIKTHKTRWEVLKNKIPVHIVYLTNFEDTTGKHIRFITDVYKRDDKLISLLMK